MQSTPDVAQTEKTQEEGDKAVPQAVDKVVEKKKKLPKQLRRRNKLPKQLGRRNKLSKKLRRRKKLIRRIHMHLKGVVIC